MKPIWKGILVAGIQVAMIASIGAKLRYDRSTRPRVWVRLRPWDPDLPIRERYLALQLEMPAEGFPSEPKTATSFYSGYSLAKAKLQIENDELVAVPTEDGNASLVNIFQENGCSMARVNEPVNFYIPENTKNPLAPRRGQAAQEAWVEVTLPRRGPPRPIRLGIKTDGSIVPLDLR